MAPVSGAQVEVNGRLAVTDSAGFFQVRIRDALRFVLNIRKEGFAVLSQVYDTPITGGRWTLYHATVLTVNPTQDLDLFDFRDERNCPGPLSERLNWQEYPSLVGGQWQDGKGNVVAPFDKLPFPLPGEVRQTNRFCGPGMRLRIPANTLVDQNGQPPAGNLTVQLFTVDLATPGQMPGDFTVQLPGGDSAVMQSYGAGIVEITAGARKYNLTAGAEAEVSIPVDPGQLAAGAPLPPTIPILFYDERNGVWTEDGSASLQGAYYVAKVRHFSAINTDQIKVDQSCLRVLSPTLPPTYDLEIIIPRGDAAPDRRTVLINNAPPSRHVIYNLPSHTNIVLVPIRVDNNIPIGTFVVNTGGPQNPTSPNLPAYPYDACSTEVVLSELAIPAQPTSGQFLHGLYSFSANNLTELDLSNPALAFNIRRATTNYYHRIDPRGKRLTLADLMKSSP